MAKKKKKTQTQTFIFSFPCACSFRHLKKNRGARQKNKPSSGEGHAFPSHWLIFQGTELPQTKDDAARVQQQQ